MSDSSQIEPRPAGFVPTRWTLVLRAQGDGPGAQAALGELCEAYYAPVLAFISHLERDAENARDLTQAFFTRLLSGGALNAAEPRHGRFRSYLLGAVKHFLAEEYRRNRTARRGGGENPVPLDAGGNETTTQLQVPDPAASLTDALFDREWAATLVDRAVSALAAENSAAGKGAQFELLKPWLLGEVPSLSQAETARQLALSEGAVKVVIHRLRKRFRELVRAEIAQTVDDSSQVPDEMRYLVEVLAQPRG